MGIVSLQLCTYWPNLLVHAGIMWLVQVAVDGSQGSSTLVVPAPSSPDTHAFLALGPLLYFTSSCCLLGVDMGTGTVSWNHSVVTPGSSLAVGQPSGAQPLVLFLDSTPANDGVVLTALDGTSGAVQYTLQVAEGPMVAPAGVVLADNQVALVAAQDLLAVLCGMSHIGRMGCL